MKNFFYYINRDKFSICDIAYCRKHDNTIDINLFDIANDKKLLKILNLVYIGDKDYTYEKRAEWFCGYLSAFKNGDISEKQYEKSMENPVVRILFTDISLMNSYLEK